MSGKIGYPRIILACMANAFNAMYRTVSEIHAHNENLGITAMENELAFQAAMAAEKAVTESIAKGESPSIEEQVDKMIDSLVERDDQVRDENLGEMKLQANELLMSAKVYILLVVQDNGSMDLFRDLSLASGADASALLVLADKAAEEVSQILYSDSQQAEDDPD